VGAHESGRIAEAPVGRPNNLMPMVMEVATGKRDRVQIFGDDYPTVDGTGVRDYIHVMDLVEGHVAALEHMDSQIGYEVYNLGQGRGVSVRELIAAVEGVTGRSIPVEVTEAVMPGVVSVPHGWGHDAPGVALRVASAHAGANSNVLASGDALDPLSGTAVLNGIPVEVVRA